MNEGFKSLKVYQLAYKLAMEIFRVSKSFPKEEVYSLTDQIRRSSRSVCTNIGEAYRKRIYPNTLLLKFQMQMENVVKRSYGWILPKIVTT